MTEVCNCLIPNARVPCRCKRYLKLRALSEISYRTVKTRSFSDSLAEQVEEENDRKLQQTTEVGTVGGLWSVIVVLPKFLHQNFI